MTRHIPRTADLWAVRYRTNWMHCKIIRRMINKAKREGRLDDVKKLKEGMRLQLLTARDDKRSERVARNRYD